MEMNHLQNWRSYVILLVTFKVIILNNFKQQILVTGLPLKFAYKHGRTLFLLRKLDFYEKYMESNILRTSESNITRIFKN